MWCGVMSCEGGTSRLHCGLEHCKRDCCMHGMCLGGLYGHKLRVHSMGWLVDLPSVINQYTVIGQSLLISMTIKGSLS